MRSYSFRGRSHLDPITDRLRPNTEEKAGKLPGAIFFAAVVGVVPLAYALDRFFGASWLISASAAIAIAAILAFNAFLLIGGSAAQRRLQGNARSYHGAALIQISAGRSIAG